MFTICMSAVRDKNIFNQLTFKLSGDNALCSHANRISCATNGMFVHNSCHLVILQNKYQIKFLQFSSSLNSLLCSHNQTFFINIAHVLCNCFQLEFRHVNTSSKCLTTPSNIGLELEELLNILNTVFT